MHNLKDLRKNLETFKKKFKDRNLDFNKDAGLFSSTIIDISDLLISKEDF